MKILNHPAVAALGITTLVFLPAINPLVEPSHVNIYHLSGSAFPIFFSAALDLGIAWLLFTALLALARRPGWLRTTIWLGIILFLPWLTLKSFLVLAGKTLPHPISLAIFALCLATFIVLQAFWRPSFQPSFEGIRSLTATVLVFASLSGVLLLVQLSWCAWQTRGLNAARPLHQHLATSAGHVPKQRLIWIVLDELSYRQVYEKRFPGLQLPAFDQLASQSTVFTHVVPTGIYTHIAFPSLMTGKRIDDIRSSADGQLSFHASTSNTWQHFDPHDTIFQDALNGGYTTAIAGWYNPYCRIMSQVLDHCYWTSHLPLADNLVANQQLTDNLFDLLPPLFLHACSIIHLDQCPEPNLIRDTNLHAQDYRDIFTAADALLSDPSVNFMLLHIPVPHPGGIYDRKTDSFTSTHSSYIDNLALADRYLAHVHKLLQQHHAWDSSTIVVMGDHSWRTKLAWSSSPLWTAEDQLASNGGQFDDRPAYIVKLPQQQEAARIDPTFAAVHTRALLDAIIDNQIQSPSDLSTWASQQTPQ